MYVVEDVLNKDFDDAVHMGIKPIQDIIMSISNKTYYRQTQLHRELKDNELIRIIRYEIDYILGLPYNLANTEYRQIQLSYLNSFLDFDLEEWMVMSVVDTTMKHHYELIESKECHYHELLTICCNECEEQSDLRTVIDCLNKYINGLRQSVKAYVQKEGVLV